MFRRSKYEEHKRLYFDFSVSETIDNISEIKRDNFGRFVKGYAPPCKSPGRKKIAPDVKKALEAATPDAVRALVEIVNNAKRDCDRLRAAEVILDRVYGKPESMSKIQLSTSTSGAIVFAWSDGNAIKPHDNSIKSSFTVDAVASEKPIAIEAQEHNTQEKISKNTVDAIANELMS